MVCVKNVFLFPPVAAAEVDLFVAPATDVALGGAAKLEGGLMLER